MAAPQNSPVPGDIRSAFIKAAIWDGSLEVAEAILAAHPELAAADIHTAAILGDEVSVRKFIAGDAGAAMAVSEPFGGNALVYLCLSKYLRLAQRAEQDFVRTAEVLLDAGADASSGFWTSGVYPEFETALYGAAGVAQNVALTRLLLQRGADPNDIEAVYHSPETYDNGAMELLVKTGKVTPVNLVLMLVRKHDWHDYEGAKFLLKNGANPNLEWRKGFYPLHHALNRSNRLEMIELLLNHGADPTLPDKGITAIAHAAREGRADVLNLLKKRAVTLNLQGADSLIAACAEDDTAQVRTIIEQQPAIVTEVKAMGGGLLARFAGNGNSAGVKQLLDIGIDVNEPFAEGDAYFGTPKNSLAIHVAAWRGYPDIVKLLIARGATIDQPDANGDTPLMLAVRACVASYWANRRSPDGVAALLAAGAGAQSVPFPSGYAAVDELLEKYQ